jgi:hypothetical protein
MRLNVVFTTKGLSIDGIPIMTAMECEFNNLVPV